jgi:cell wall-associated NlpC family hydrolase
MVRSSLPVRRVAVSSAATLNRPPAFASLLQTANRTSSSPAAFSSPLGGSPPVQSRSQVLENAQKLMNVPYVWGGNSANGLDCSAFVSKAWGVSRHTTDNLASIARPISKDELQAGDALNLTTSRDSDGSGHIRLFDKWANGDKTMMWVYEETPPRSVHHVINWDPNYTPMRRLNVTN